MVIYTVLNWFVFIIPSLFVNYYSLDKNYKLVQQSNPGDIYTFAWKVFAAWDFTITDDVTIENRRRNHAISLREALFEAQKKGQDEAILDRFEWGYN